MSVVVEDARVIPNESFRSIAFPDGASVQGVASDYPTVAFTFGSGIGPAEPNFAVFDNWIHEPAYLAGMIAGKLTKTNTVGTVAAMAIPEVNRISNAFCAGAKEVNDKVKCKFSFIGSFFDPPKAKEAAIAQIEAGVDVIYAERFGVIEAAKERGIAAIGNMSDQTGLGPDTVVTSVVWDMWPTVKQVISLVKAGVFTAQDFGQFSYMGKGGSFLAPYHAWDKKLSDDIKKMVADRRQEILDGTFRITINESAPKSD
ncbi:MAG: BMP family protein [Proteobacteria bacterium]|nr:BMP family protein [Pseudomonadota bacterium]